MADGAGAIAEGIGAAAQIAGTVQSLSAKQPKAPKPDPVPTLNDAASSVQTRQEQDRARIASGGGASSDIGPVGVGGVSTDDEKTAKILLGGF